ACVSLLAHVAAQWTFRAACEIYDTEYRSIWGRAAVYRLSQLDWDEIGSTERQSFLAAMTSRAADPLVKKAIPIALDPKKSWAGAYNEICTLVSTDERWSSVPAGVRADQALNEICWLFYTSGNSYFIAGILRDWAWYLNADLFYGYPYYLLSACRS